MSEAIHPYLMKTSGISLLSAFFYSLGMSGDADPVMLCFDSVT
jgi:hypothetical protein